MESILDVRSLRLCSGEWRRRDLKIALVPTLGNLHSGHLSLLERAGEMADRTIVSIFVNPIQFGVGEDYHTYPSTIDEDMAKLHLAGVEKTHLDGWTLGSSLNDLRPEEHPPTNNRLKSIGLQELKNNIYRFS